MASSNARRGRRGRRKKLNLSAITTAPDAPLDAQHIRQVVSARYTGKLWAVNFEVGLCKGGRFRADVLAVNMGGGIEITEVKSSVQDFRSDKKMSAYLRFCEKLYVACTAEVYEKIKDQVLPGVGVYVVGRDSIFVARKARRRDVDSKIQLSILTRMAYRSADATLHERKNKGAGKKYVAEKVMSAIREIPKPRTRPQVVQAIENALTGFV